MKRTTRSARRQVDNIIFIFGFFGFLALYSECKNMRIFLISKLVGLTMLFGAVGLYRLFKKRANRYSFKHLNIIKNELI